MDNIAALIAILVLAFFLWKCCCKSGNKLGMVPNNKDMALLKVVGEDNFFDRYKVRCPGDKYFGNQIQLLNPVDMYSNVKNKSFGYVFRHQDDPVTKGIYKSAREAADAYCANPDRVISSI
jgi:hypothetical protein